MTRRWRITKDDNADLGFANAAFMAGVITVAEFRNWAERVVMDTPADDLPVYMFDLLDMPETGLSGIWRDALRFYPYDPFLTAARDDALTALAYCRGIKRRFDPDWMTEAEAATILARTPEIFDRLKTVLPDIAISVPEVAR